MNKQSKKTNGILSALLLVLILTLVAGCGNSNNNSSRTPASSATSTPSGSASTPDGKKSAEGVVVNIESSQIGPILIAKEKGIFEEEFAKFGATVKYQALQSTSQFLEAVASNRLDFVRLGYIGPITAQEAGIQFTTIGEGSEGKGDAILVQKDSPLQSVKELKGKKVAVAKGSGSWGLLLRALNKEGLKLSDITLLNLQNDEAQAAFQSGKIDAWVTWEPFVSNQIKNNGAKSIAKVQDIGVYSPAYNIVRTKLAQEHPELVGAYLKAFQRALDWQNKNFDEAVALLAKVKNLDENTIRISLQNNPAINVPVSEEANKNQQITADILYELGEIKQKLDVTKNVDNSYITKALEEYKAEHK